MSSCCSQKNTSFPILDKPQARPSWFAAAKPYRPLIVMVVLVLIAAVTISVTHHIDCMPLFMGLFLLTFSMFKLFDLDGFAKSFAMYDVIGKRSVLYAKAYPFIELGLGIGYLAHLDPLWINGLTAFVMGVGLVGIVRNRLSGSAVKCACMGNLIDVPVGSVTILENTSMILMALWALWM